MKRHFRWVIAGACAVLVASACVGEEPKVGGKCAQIAGTWSISGDDTCSVDTSCTVTQTGCSATMTCDDGTRSTSGAVTSSGFSLSVTTADNIKERCTGTLDGNDFTAKCTASGQSCTITGHNTTPTPEGDASTGGGSGRGGSGAKNSTGGGGSGATSTGGSGGEIPPGSGGTDAGNSGSGGSTPSDGGADAGPPGSGKVGDPCRVSTDCESGACAGAGWCTKNSCTSDADCGTSSTGHKNYCGQNNNQQKVCFPECSSDSDCEVFSTSDYCHATTSGISICSLRVVDDPCTSGQTCFKGTCNGSWCAASCTADADCGTNLRGKQNVCLTNSASQKTCFPGCTIDGDCAAYSGTFCHAVTGKTGSICSIPHVGDPCSASLACGTGTCNSRWCASACTQDSDCGFTSAGQKNRCIQNASGSNVCFPGCTTNGDCAAYSGTTCQPPNSGTGNLCAVPSTSGGTSSHGFIYGTAMCATCATTNCDAEESTCAADTACAGFFECASACAVSDTTCVMNCITALSSTSLSAADDMLTCLNTSCSTCGVPK